MGGFLILIGGLGALYLLWQASGVQAGGATKTGGSAAPAGTPTEAPAKGPAKASAKASDGGARPATPAREPEPEPAMPERPAHLVFHEARPDRVDDLRRIKGIGPKMEAILNEHGIYQYEQIAAFGEADLAWLDGATGSFPGRAARDGWVEQAAGLAAERGGD